MTAVIAGDPACVSFEAADPVFLLTNNYYSDTLLREIGEERLTRYTLD